MEPVAPAKCTLWRQSSMAPDREHTKVTRELGENYEDGDGNDIDPGLKLLYMTNEADLDAIQEILDSGTDVNFQDIDSRTALHVAACQGYTEVAKLLIERGAKIDPKDKWGSTPLADAIHYKNHVVVRILEKHGAKPIMTPMHVKNAREVPEYEIDPQELDFTNSIDITKGTFRIASWGGTKVAVKTFWEGNADDDKLRAFGDELSLLQKIRHPNVVQFLGAVTQSSPMMIVTEYLPKGDLHEYLKRKGALKPTTALRIAMDIARGMNYLHEHKPEAIIHRDLEPANILVDDSGHMKVADFGVSKLLKVANRVKEDRRPSCQDSSCRYVAPEVFRIEEYDTKADVFSFALILQEMIEGCPPFCSKQDHEVPESYVAKQRPPFRANSKNYAHGLKELIIQCWSENPANRPTFKQIIPRLEAISNSFSRRKGWKFFSLKCFQSPDLKIDESNLGCRSSRSPQHT